MPISKAQIRANTKYESRVYDKICLRIPKGDRFHINVKAFECGMSLNAFVIQAIQEKIDSMEIDHDK
jgi:predicted HicB family RNase H-like nuclease